MSIPVETGDRLLAVVAPVVALTVGGVGRSVGTLLATGTSDSLVAYGGTTVAVLGFAGLLVRQLVQSSSAWKEIVSSLQGQLDQEQQQHNYTRWEREMERHLAGKRDNPGPAPSVSSPNSPRSTVA